MRRKHVRSLERWPCSEPAVREAWTALTARDTAPVEAFLTNAHSHPWFLAPVGAVYRRLPAPRTGLDFYEARLLRSVVELGERTVEVVRNPRFPPDRFDHSRRAHLVGPVLFGLRGAAAIGDVLLFDAVERMQTCPVPLWTWAGGPARLTEAGAAVLAGEANHVELNGIDRWVGGMHLSSAEGRVFWRNTDLDPQL